VNAAEINHVAIALSHTERIGDVEMFPQAMPLTPRASGIIAAGRQSTPTRTSRFPRCDSADEGQKRGLGSITTGRSAIL
jgi:hypothetical protein